MKINRRNKETSLQDAQLYDRVTQLQTYIIDKLNTLRKGSKGFVCWHVAEMPPEPEDYDSNQNYYAKFWKLYLQSQIYREKIRASEEDGRNWETELEKIQVAFQRLAEIRGQKVVTKPKTRRRSSDIDKKYECKVPNCFKSYGTEPALRLHERQKHGLVSSQKSSSHNPNQL